MEYNIICARRSILTASGDPALPAWFVVASAVALYDTFIDNPLFFVGARLPGDGHGHIRVTYLCLPTRSQRARRFASRVSN
jgi:hypothetical protein